MACTSINLSGISLDCGNTGGVSKVYIAPIEDVATVTVDLSGEISGITMVSGKTFAEYSVKRGNSNFAVTGSRDDKASTKSFETVLTAQFNAMDKVKRSELNNMTKTYFYAIVKDNNGIYWLIGYDANTQAYAYGNVNAQSGAEMADANSYTLTLTSQTSELPMTVASSVISNII